MKEKQGERIAYNESSARTDESFRRHIRPRFTVYENVAGALSSNKGKDWARVLEETIRVVEPEAPDIPVPENGWPTAGCFMADDGRWSVAYRLMDAQHWGVPQRRKRLALVADYGGATAPKIVFECDTRGASRSDGAEDSAGETGKYLCGDVSGTLDASYYKGQGQREGVEREFIGESTTIAIDRGMNWDGSETCFTLTANNANGAQRMPDKENLSCVLSAVGVDAYNQSVTGEVSKPLTSSATDSDHIPLAYAVDVRNSTENPDVNGTLCAKESGGWNANSNGIVRTATAFAIGSYDSNSWRSGNPHSGVNETEVAKSLDSANCGNPSCNQGGTAVVEPHTPPNHQYLAYAKCGVSGPGQPVAATLAGGHNSTVSDTTTIVL